MMFLTYPWRTGAVMLFQGDSVCVWIVGEDIWCHSRKESRRPTQQERRLRILRDGTAIGVSRASVNVHWLPTAFVPEFR